MLELGIALLTSAITLWSMWLAGNNKAFGWLVGVANQAVWFIFILVFQAWGLLPLNVALTFVYARNFKKWTDEEQDLDEFTAESIDPNFSKCWCGHNHMMYDGVNDEGMPVIAIDPDCHVYSCQCIRFQSAQDETMG